MTRDGAILKIIHDLTTDKADIQTDNEGQLIIYTGLYYSGTPDSITNWPEILEQPDPTYKKD